MDADVSKPLVTVIMPVFNAAAYVGEAVKSILQQTFTNFEFLIIDDASIDDSVNIIRLFNDERIQLIQKPVNTGYTDSLNYGLSIAKGIYIARMDADDISYPDRFAQQVQYMQTHPETLVLGTAYKILGTETIITLPLTNDEAKVIAIMHVPVAHPTVMIRRKVLEEYGLRYNKKFEPAEDYDLWTRILEIGKIENLQLPLLYYRKHEAQQSTVRYKKLIEGAVEIRQRQLIKIVDLQHARYDILFAIDILTKAPLALNAITFKKMIGLFKDMENGNKNNRAYNDRLLHSYLKERWQFLYTTMEAGAKRFTHFVSFKPKQNNNHECIFFCTFLKHSFVKSRSNFINQKIKH